MNIQITSVDFEYKNHEKNYSLLLFRHIVHPAFLQSFLHTLLSHPITSIYYSLGTYAQKLLKPASLPKLLVMPNNTLTLE